jgi:hypothetical protein
VCQSAAPGTVSFISPQIWTVGHSLVLLKLRKRLTPYLLLGLLALFTGVGIGFGISAAGAATGRNPLTVQGHGTFGSCLPAGIVETVSINRGLLGPGDPLIVRLTAKNVGNTDCQYGGLVSKTGVASIGPCGVVPLTILNSKGNDVWPGSRVEFCPFSKIRILHAGESIHAQGQWTFVRTNWMPIPPGRYTVEVALRLRLSVVIEK